MVSTHVPTELHFCLLRERPLTVGHIFRLWHKLEVCRPVPAGPGPPPHPRWHLWVPWGSGGGIFHQPGHPTPPHATICSQRHWCLNMAMSSMWLCGAACGSADQRPSPPLPSLDPLGWLRARGLGGRPTSGRRGTRRAASRHGGGALAAVLLALIRCRWFWAPSSKVRRYGYTIVR